MVQWKEPIKVIRINMVTCKHDLHSTVYYQCISKHYTQETGLISNPTRSKELPVYITIIPVCLLHLISL